MIKIKALILAAGYATRLYPLTKNFPKPLLKIAGKPMINYIIEKIAPVKEIDGIYIVTNNKFYSHFTEWLSGFKCNKKIEIINDHTMDETDKLGAIGDMKYLIEKKGLDDDLFVVGGDNLFEFDVQDVVNFFYDKKDAVVVLHDVKHHKLAMRFGVVEIDENERMISFVEKPKNPQTTLIAICMYIFPKKDLELIKEYIQMGKNPDQPGRYIEWLHTVRHTFGFVFEGHWFDIGNYDKLQEADEVYKKKLEK